jgi:DNA repair photolyase
MRSPDLPRGPRRGRGATGNPAGRFERFDVEPLDDGWGSLERELAERPQLETEVTERQARSIIATNDSPDVPFERSINPYQGCEHGCIYCFARPTHSYLGLSPGLDFESRIFAKPNAAELLEAALRRRSYSPAAIALGSNTDPYQPVERRLRITRSVLEVLSRFDHPLSIVTKSFTVVRDIDILGPMAGKNLARVYLSVTTLDDELARRMEPRASTPARRIEALRRLADAGVPCGLLFSPVVPALNDHELERVLEAATAAGAVASDWLLLRLPWEVASLFEQWLRANYPLRAERVLSRIRELRDGRLNDPRFALRHRGTGQQASVLEARFQLAARRLGLVRKLPPLETALFHVPDDTSPQGRLFD